MRSDATQIGLRAAGFAAFLAVFVVSGTIGPAGQAHVDRSLAGAAAALRAQAALSTAPHACSERPPCRPPLPVHHAADGPPSLPVQDDGRQT